jgi:hypothetical protein
LRAFAGPDGVIRAEELCCVCDAAGFIHVRFRTYIVVVEDGKYCTDVVVVEDEE